MKNIVNYRFGARILATVIALLFAASASARSGLGYRGFSGGMMLHSGWVNGGSMEIGGKMQDMAGLPMGIGGALKVQLGDHLRVGTEGYTSALAYGDFNSSLSVGWGGLLVDWAFVGRSGKTSFFGATVGGGSVKNLTLNTEPADDFVAEEGVSFRRYAVPLITPFVGMEYPLTERINVVLKADCLIPLSDAPDFPLGVRLYVGFMFGH
ncbi:MAG: hypothetical protein J6Q40_00200 [Tidjanibacter sp.]|nr:hypothetical protein [Tidjanibacter sp.]